MKVRDLGELERLLWRPVHQKPEFGTTKQSGLGTETVGLVNNKLCLNWTGRTKEYFLSLGTLAVQWCEKLEV